MGTYYEKNLELFKRLVLSGGRTEWLKPGYQVICLHKSSSKIVVLLQYTEEYISYGRLFTSCQSSGT